MPVKRLEDLNAEREWECRVCNCSNDAGEDWCWNCNADRDGDGAIDDVEDLNNG